MSAQASAVAREGPAELPGVRIWYRDTGGPGVPVVFLHAATGSSRVWEHQIPAFTARSYRLIAYDRRGFGQTVIEATGPQPRSGADDLLALVNQLGIERFHLVGTAAGAFVALDFALSFPQRLRTLVIANSIGGVQDEDYLEASTSRSRLIFLPRLGDHSALPPGRTRLRRKWVRRCGRSAIHWRIMSRIASSLSFAAFDGLRPTVVLSLSNAVGPDIPLALSLWQWRVHCTLR